MPIYDPAIRSGKSNTSSGGSSSVSVSISAIPGVTAGDLIVVGGMIASGGQINPPSDGGWTRLNGNLGPQEQYFTKIYAPGMSQVFTWDGTNQAFVFKCYALFSQGGGTISVDAGVSPNPVHHNIFPTSSITSDAITPTQNALVLVDYIEFLLGAISGPAGLTVVENEIASWGGYIYVPAGQASLTYTASGGSTRWAAATFAFVSSIPNPLKPPLLTDEALFTPATQISAHPPLLTDEALFLPEQGIVFHLPLLTDEALFTPSGQSGVHPPLLSDEALFLPSGGISNPSPPLLSDEALFTPKTTVSAFQAFLLSDELIFTPKLNVVTLFAPLLSDEAIFTPHVPTEFPFCLLTSGLKGIPFEVQTPAKLLDEGRLALCSRFFIRVNTNGEKLKLMILVDKQEFLYPLPIQTANLQTVPVSFQVSGRIYSIRLSGCLSTGQVEFYAAWTDLDEGREPQVQEAQGG